jgi:diaminohydroxyphosphoribosylaminopyrimidine deaminase/5-amino-6-(5-phosphoribosylamino)uracil reductase
VSDERFMAQALKLAQRGLGNTSPNPLVGAVVVDPSGAVVGTGYHERAGGEHAEAGALRTAGERARGATLYVTLEPCVHQGRTPACTEAIATAGVARVVSAIDDPDTNVAGRGHARLRQAGIAVTIGVGAAAATRVNRMYLHHRSTGLPFVTLKMAQSLNGVVAAQSGQRVQLTGKRATKFVRALRYEHDAVMVGAGTILTDDPQLTVRPFKPRAVPYVRVIVDARGRISPAAKVLKDLSRYQTIVATTELMPDSLRASLLQRGVKLLLCQRGENDLVDLRDALRQLAAAGITSVLSEGGPTLAGSLLSGGHANELVWLLAPELLGGENPVAVINDLGASVKVRIDTLKRLGDDVVLTAQVHG